MSPRVWTTRGLVSAIVQLLWKSSLADEPYVTQRAWEGAILDSCPFHPQGGCGLHKLGSYGRVDPAGVRVPRWWCPQQRASVSLLPSFLAARLSGTLRDVEHVVAAVEASGGVSAAVDAVYPPEAPGAIGLVGAVRSIRRRVSAVRAALLAIATLMPERFAAVRPTMEAFRQALGVAVGQVLVTLREQVMRHLHALPVPFGLRPRGAG